MPNIDLITIPQYQSNQPYHYFYDNLPLEAIIQREDMINNAVDINSELLRQSVGTAGTLANRLNQSLQSNGNLKTTAVDTALHNIGYHTDGAYDGVDYVRMTLSERDKLSLIAQEANNLSIGIDGPSAITYVTDGVVTLEPSTTIEWTLSAGQKLRADVTVGLTNAHQHFDNITPVAAALTSNYKDYLTNLTTAFTTGSLKVFINGVRIFQDTTVYAPTSSPLSSWQLNSFTENEDGLGFSLLNAITINDIIKIDFEVPLG
jgi:hypothetical protein